ncbi:TrmH family RNA methyltransferase [Streptomyces sp. RFCAC02]|uniref:TrmH family RNA methyltransferase n=1 Tax=Streptomyces sp. RFCAC02 TaxID=2499143 RepID=UPI00101F6D8C|nr:TrmH family RNA methyltransferase [Streptomyces sp. RFCAC02]
MNDAADRWRELAAGPAVLLDGFHALKHAVRFGAEVPLAVTSDKPAALALAADLAPDVAPALDALLTPVPAAVLAALVTRPHPTGVAALAVPAPREPVRDAPVVVLDNPRHLGNIGAVVRLAAGAGAGGVLTTGTADPWHPAVLRAAAGLHWATAVRRCTTAELPPGPLYALDPDGADLRTVTIEDGALLAFGSERAGLSPAVRARATTLLALPMRPRVSSYNLATSVAMTLYHWMARRPPA